MDLMEKSAKERILISATEEFVLNGYSGTSIKDISCNANVTTSLIFHHFKSKSCLWNSVKESLLESLELSKLSMLEDIKYDNFDYFIETLLKEWLYGLFKNSDLVRFLKWQMLEHRKIDSVNNEELESLFFFSNKPNGWRQFIEVLKKFQCLGNIKENVDCVSIARIIIGGIHAGFHNPLYALNSITKLDEYRKFLVHTIKYSVVI